VRVLQILPGVELIRVYLLSVSIQQYTIIKYILFIVDVGSGPPEAQNVGKRGSKMGPKKRGPGPPGRGVLHFSSRGYRNPVHIFEKIAVFSKNVPI